VDSAILWRVAVVQAAAVAVLSLLLALVFSHGFFAKAKYARYRGVIRIRATGDSGTAHHARHVFLFIDLHQ